MKKLLTYLLATCVITVSATSAFAANANGNDTLDANNANISSVTITDLGDIDVDLKVGGTESIFKFEVDNNHHDGYKIRINGAPLQTTEKYADDTPVNGPGSNQPYTLKMKKLSGTSGGSVGPWAAYNDAYVNINHGQDIVFDKPEKATEDLVYDVQAVIPASTDKMDGNFTTSLTVDLEEL